MANSDQKDSNHDGVGDACQPRDLTLHYEYGDRGTFSADNGGDLPPTADSWDRKLIGDFQLELIADNVYAGTATMDYQAETSEAFPWPGFPDRSLTCQTTAEGAPQSSPKVIVTFGSAGVPTVEFVVDPAHPDAFNAYERRTCADGTDQLLPFPPMIGSHPEVAWQLPGTAIIAERLWHEPTNNYPPGWDADVYELIRVSAATAPVS